MYDIYSNDRDDHWRYVLGESGKGKLFVVGLNPSTATKEKSDNTVTKAREVAKRSGYNGFVMLNLYPVRATDYSTLPDKPDPEAVAANLNAIESIVSMEPSPTIWAAWGQSVLEKPFFISGAKLLIERLRKYEPKWLHFGDLTRDGHPRHPRQLSYDWAFAEFKVEDYLNKLG